MLVALLGVLLAPVFVTLFTPGFVGHQRELMIRFVRIIFPVTGVLVLSAWALGILNSHRYFFVPYFAPVMWNVRHHRGVHHVPTVGFRSTGC